MFHLTFSDLRKLREDLKDKTIVFCSGGFDLTHAGHVLFFEDCKKYGDVLVVGLGSDAARRSEKEDDGRPIINEIMRLKMISSLKPVDYAFVIEHLAENHKLDPLNKIFEVLRPDVYAINADASHIPYREELVKKFGAKLVVLDRWCPPEYENISTTKLIEKIKKINPHT